MRLLYTSTAYPPYIGGAQLLQHKIAQQLSDRYSIQVVSQWDQNRTDWLLGTTLTAPQNSRNYVVDTIPVHRIGLSTWEKLKLAPFVPFYYPFMKVTLPIISTCLEQHLTTYSNQADLIHNVRIGREGLSYASWQAARKRNLPFVLTPVHHPRWVGWRYQAYLKLYQLADAVIALTQAEKRILIELGVQENRITVTGMGAVLAPQIDSASTTIAANSFLQKHQINAPIVLFLGQHYPYKGYRQVLEAAKLVWQKVPEAQFVFIGPAVAQSEQAFVEFSDSRIHRLGKVDLEEKTSAIAACTLLCVPSTQESFGGVYTEAWSFAKPVIGCPIPAVSEVITDGVDGYLVAQKATSIADRICDLLLNPAQAKKLGEAGQRKVESHYTWQRIAQKTEQVYQRLTA